MVEVPPRRRRQHTRTREALLACVLATMIGCSSAPSVDPVEPDAALELSRDVEADRLEAALAAAPRPGPEDELVVRLAFGADVDLDLFVSDPRSETVYFANRRARSGGRLAADLRCDAPAPRIETVRFEHPLPGRYRIGVDYPGACGGDAKPAVFVLEWRAGDRGRLARGRAQPLVFDTIAMEFELSGREPAAAR
jgi:hypothetical protein